MKNKSTVKATLFPLVKPLAIAICTVLSATATTQVFAALGDKVGNEFRVNTITYRQKQEPAIATNGSGASVITWASRSQTTANGGYDIYAQRYNSSGAKAGAEFLVNVVGSGDKNTPDVALDANGNFVIVWRSYQQDGDEFGIYGQRYDANGVKVNDEFLVNTNIVDDQENPQIAMNANGDYVVTWQSFSNASDYDIFAQRYSADGNTLSGEFLVNTETNDIQSKPSIAMDSTGDFVVTWQSGSDFVADIYGQCYQADGNVSGGEFIVNTTTNNGQLNPSVAMDNSGNFVVAWDSFGQEPVTSSGATQTGVYAQRFDTSGNKVGGDFLVNTEVTDDQMNPDIAMNAEGDFVVTWQSENQTAAANGIYDVYAQRYSNTGSAVGSEVLVNTEIEDNQSNPVVAMDSTGEFVIVWQSYNQVPSGDIDIYAQRFEGAADNTAANTGGGSGGALSWLMGILLLPFALRRKHNPKIS